MELDLATVLLQWAAGGMVFCWVTTRHRVVGLGYGWLLRSTYGLLALGALVAGVVLDDGGGTGALVRDVGAGGVATLAAVGLAVSVARRRAGASAQEQARAARAARVAAMAGRGDDAKAENEAEPEVTADALVVDREFPPVLDLLAGLAGLVALSGAAAAVGGPYGQSLARLVVGALFLGVVTDAMLLGHWYLVQPGLTREPIRELVRWLAIIWPFEVLVFCWSVGMVQVLSGSIDDGVNGLFGWIWAACAVSTIVLAGVTWAALKERQYSAVMAATGLLYLAILTAFGTDLVARAALTP